MICYKDREYCGREDCRWYKWRPGCGKDWKQCPDSVDFAIKETMQSKDQGVRELPISFSLWTGCPDFEPKSDDHRGD